MFPREVEIVETISIRSLRGADLQERARRGRPLAVTNHGALVGVIIPVSTAWVEHLIYENWARVRQRIAAGEQVIADAEVTPVGCQSLVPLAATMVGETVVQAPESEEAVDRLRVALNPRHHAAGAHDNGSAESSLVRRIRIGDLSAGQIEKAGLNGHTLAITHDRKLIGILIPVTQGLVHFLIEQNISGVLDNIKLGEDQLNGEA